MGNMHLICVNYDENSSYSVRSLIGSYLEVWGDVGVVGYEECECRYRISLEYMYWTYIEEVWKKSALKELWWGHK